MRRARPRRASCRPCLLRPRHHDRRERNMRSRMDPSRRGMHAYYDQRAPEFDDWWEGKGQFAARERPGWNEELGRLDAVVRALPRARVLDVGCGTGYVTQRLAATLLVAVDQSQAMTT